MLFFCCRNKCVCWLGGFVCLLSHTGAGVAGYTEAYFQYANGDGSHYIASYTDYSEQECADECTNDLDCFSFEWRDPNGANGNTGNCKTSYFNEIDGPGLEDSDAEEWSFYEADEVTCPDYPDIDNSVQANSGSAKGDLEVVACDADFFGGGTSVCLGTGQWDQMYSCYGTTSDLVIAATDCTWRAEDDDAPGKFETGSLDALPTYWVEEEWNYRFCWTGGTTIGTATIDIDACKALCDADTDCTGATHDGTDCTTASGNGTLTLCGGSNYGYQQRSDDMDAVLSNNFAHCGDASVVYTVTTEPARYEWAFVGCFDQESYFKNGDFVRPTPGSPNAMFRAAVSADPAYPYVGFAYVGGDAADGDSVAILFSELWKTASDASGCQVPCDDDTTIHCGDQTLMNEYGLGSWAVYLRQPVGEALSIKNDNVTAPSTFKLYAGQRYLAHMWALVQRHNNSHYPPYSLEVQTRISGDDAAAFSSNTTHQLKTAFEWTQIWHDMFMPASDVDFAALTVGAHQMSIATSLYIDDVIVYCVTCCYPTPDLFLPDRMYLDDETLEVGKLASESGFWNEDVSSEYTTAVFDTFVTQVCGTATGDDSSFIARMGLATTYDVAGHSVVGGDYVIEMGAEGLARAYNSEAEPACGCWVVRIGANPSGGYYKTELDMINAPLGKWTYGVYASVSSDWDGLSSLFQVRWFASDGSTITTTSTGAWINVDNEPVYGEFTYATKTVTLTKAPTYAEIYLGAPAFNDAGTIDIFSIALIDPSGRDWLRGKGKSECGASVPGFLEVSGNATIREVTCEAFMSPFWTEHALEGVDSSVDVLLFDPDDRGCVTYVQNMTFTQTTDYTGNSWDFYDSCEEFCTAAGSTCNAARYQETGDAVECKLGPVPDALECQCTDPLIVYSVTTNDDFDTSLNVGTTDDSILTGGGNLDSSFEVATDEECMVLCRDKPDCAMFEFYDTRSCMLYSTDFTVVTDTCYGRYTYSDRTTGACATSYEAFDSGAGSNDAMFDDLQTIIDDQGYTAGSRDDMDEECQRLCDSENFDCLAYGVADDDMFAGDAYVCELYVHVANNGAR